MTREDRGQRPGTLAMGAVLIVARALGGVLWSISLVRSTPQLAAENDVELAAAELIVGVAVVFQGVWMLILLLLAWLVWRGHNWARVLVMLGTTLSIISAAIGHFASDEAITIRTTLLTLALDILILLALSSRDSRRWCTKRPRIA